MGKRQKLGILSYSHIWNRITKDFACLKDLSADIIVNCVKFFKSPLNCLWKIVYKSRELSLALLLFLSSLKELSLSYFVGKPRQSYRQIVELIKGVILEPFCLKVQTEWLQIVELIKGVVLELFCFKSPESHLWQQRGYTFKEALTQTHKQNIVGWLELVVIFYPAQHFHHCIYFIRITAEITQIAPIHKDYKINWTS